MIFIYGLYKNKGMALQLSIKGLPYIVRNTIISYESGCYDKIHSYITKELSSDFDLSINYSGNKCHITFLLDKSNWSDKLLFLVTTINKNQMYQFSWEQDIMVQGQDVEMDNYKGVFVFRT